MPRHTMLAVLVGCLVLSLPCLAAEFTSPEGFSLQYPDDWVVISKQEREAVLQAARPVLQDLGAVNAPGFAVLIRSPELDEFSENVNVVVTPGAVPINAKAEKEYTAQAQQQMGAAGANVTNFTCQRTNIAGRDAISAHYDVTMPGVPQALRQWQVVMPGGGKMYFVTCSALQSEFDQFEPVFSTIVKSIQIEGAPPGFWAELSRPLRYAIIGAIIGGIIGAVVGVVRKLLSG